MKNLIEKIYENGFLITVIMALVAVLDLIGLTVKGHEIGLGFILTFLFFISTGIVKIDKK